MGTSKLFVDDRTGGDRSVMPIVLVHGAPDRSKNFAAVIAELGDLPVITYDRRGYGKSIDVMPPAQGFGDHADDLIEILDGRRAVVCAQSVGCNVAMTAAARAPELVAALGVWEPPNAWCDWWPHPGMYEAASRLAASTDTEAMAEGYNRQILGDERWEALADRTKQMLRAEVLGRFGKHRRCRPFGETIGTPAQRGIRGDARKRIGPAAVEAQNNVIRARFGTFLRRRAFDHPGDLPPRFFHRRARAACLLHRHPGEPAGSRRIWTQVVIDLIHLASEPKDHRR